MNCATVNCVQVCAHRRQIVNCSTVNCELHTAPRCTGRKPWIVNCVQALGAHRRQTMNCATVNCVQACAHRRQIVNCATVNCELRTGARCTQEADNALWLGLCNHQYGIFTHCFCSVQDDLQNCISPLYQTYPYVSVSEKLLFNHQYGIFTRWSSQPWWYIVLPSVTNTARDFDCVAV